MEGGDFFLDLAIEEERSKEGGTNDTDPNEQVVLGSEGDQDTDYFKADRDGRDQLLPWGITVFRFWFDRLEWTAAGWSR